MKKIIILQLATLTVACLLFSGCVSTKEVSPAVPAQPAVTNSSGVITAATPGTPAKVEYVVDPRLQKISDKESEIYGQVAPVAGAIYPPAAPILTVADGIFGSIMSVISAVSLIFANRKNKQKLTAEAVTRTIIQGVESAGDAAVEIKKSITKTAIANGNADHVESAVNQVTGN